ncbi:pilus assembly protein TadB [Saccharopolyspora rhizosphaerae]|uniref:Pilus assembly protein TadB n=1 Tax=Saccharopolyspora rhizosphaerae TaxID=2492662 RepID=A0A426JV30_9PSEU|nr:pilus assembly protein TadB [Saccharopolyspora rhizosphaerae]RRO17055.1 pilus assembly protein TadB [Saccharopolyspora rhizosphaerae]
MIIALAAVFGLFLGLGLLFSVLFFRPPRPPTMPSRVSSVLAWLERWRRRGLIASLAAGVTWWATGWPVATAATVLGVLAVPALLAPRQVHDDIALHEAMATWTRRLSDLLASGAGGLHQAVARSADTAPALLAPAVARLAEAMRREGTEPALRAFAAEVSHPAADEVVLALLLRVRAGGRGVVEILQGQAVSLTARAASAREVEADRAKPRTTVRTLIGITTVMILGLVVFARDYLAPISTALGQGVLAVVVAIFAGALWHMHRLSTPRAAARYLRGGTS